MENNRPVTFKKIEDFLRSIATAHVDINGFYTIDFAEFNGSFRQGVGLPAMLMESYSSEPYSETQMVTNFNRRNNSILIIDHAGASDDYEKKTDVLTHTEGIALDIQSYFVKCTKDKSHWLFGLFDINSVQVLKVGPLFDNMHGWNVLFDLKSQEKMCYVPEKWQWPSE